MQQELYGWLDFVSIILDGFQKNILYTCIGNQFRKKNHLLLFETRFPEKKHIFFSKLVTNLLVSNLVSKVAEGKTLVNAPVVTLPSAHGLIIYCHFGGSKMATGWGYRWLNSLVTVALLTTSSNQEISPSTRSSLIIGSAWRIMSVRWTHLSHVVNERNLYVVLSIY